MFTSSIEIDDVIDALAAFLTPFMLGGQVTRGQVNRVPLAEVPSAMLTEMRQYDLEFSTEIADSINQNVTIYSPRKIDVQIDLFGIHAAEICSTIKAAFKSSYAFSVMPENIKPLYIDDGVNSQMVTGENQYETRWTLTATLQYNPSVVVPQQSAIAANVTGLIPADVFY